MKAYERLLNYVTFNTQSDPDSKTYPSTNQQLTLLNHLLNELRSMGVEASIDHYGYVIGKIPANTTKSIPKLALIAHVDTSPDASGNGIKPRIIHSYNGDSIVLNKEKNILLSPEIFPHLSRSIGHDLIVTDGTTLLGADDKAGVAEIMTVVDYLQSNPSVLHGEIRIVFTPDEEVGRGTDYINIDAIDADFGFTLDGSAVGEIAYENFNAASAKLTFHGVSVHPGSAKNKMINAINLAYEFDSMLSKEKRPETTSGYEGFNHLSHIIGACELARTQYIIRNHDKQEFENQKQSFVEAKNRMNQAYKAERCELVIEDSYYNMKTILDQHPTIIDLAMNAIRQQGIDPIVEPIRGGTDGARLTYMGLPCPNLGTGGYNFHGPYEYADIQEMDQAVEIVKTIIQDIVKK